MSEEKKKQEGELYKRMLDFGSIERDWIDDSMSAVYAVFDEAKAEYPTIQQAEDLFKKTFPTWPSDPISDKGKKKLIADYLQLLVDNWFKKWFGEP